jgi:tRNA pseudouridine38-40 synthase
LLIEYDGVDFAGWQRQRSDRTVEAELKRAIEAVTGAEPTIYAAGRTDAGAHAEGQVANFRHTTRLAPARLAAAVNAHLPSDVVILRADEVPDDFHARYSARWRRYRYRFLDRTARPALERGRCWHLRAGLDEVAMADASRALAGRHDWTTFCAASEPAADRTRTIREVTLARRGHVVELHLLGEGFLRGMVRGIAGALAEVGTGRRPPAWIGEILAARDRGKAARTAPAAGLTLVEVLYDEDAGGYSSPR